VGKHRFATIPRCPPWMRSPIGINGIITDPPKNKYIKRSKVLNLKTTTIKKIERARNAIQSVPE